MKPLAVQTLGPENGLQVVLLHGFLSDSRQWQDLTTRVQKLTKPPIRWILPDLPGHGQSPDFPPSPDWTELVEQLEIVVQGQFVLGGYSLGGRIAAVWAHLKPQRIQALWLESAQPPLEPEDVAHRREVDELRAYMLETSSLADFVDMWAHLPLFASQKKLAKDVLEQQKQLRLAQDPLGLAQSLRWYGSANMPQDLQLSMDTHFLLGELDTGVASRVHAWQARAPRLQVTRVPKIGHAIHLEAPEIAAKHLADLLNQLHT